MKILQTFLQNRLNQLMVGASVLLLIITLVLKPDSSESAPSSASSPQADTYIPAGFVLIPLEIVNIESIKGLIGNYGVVDLFRISEDKQEPRLIARHVKLIRAPLDPDHFAVLVSENETSPILTGMGPIMAVIQNPQAESTQVFKSHKKISRVIVGQ